MRDNPYSFVPGGYFFLPTGVLATVTPTGSDTMTTPVSVVTEARRLCGPSATAVVSHFTVVDPSVSTGPSGCPSRWNCRLATALSLVMAALTSTEPFTVAPAAGLLIRTVGTGLLTTTGTASDTTVAPPCRVTMATSVCMPLGVVSVVQRTRPVGDVSAGPRFTPSSWNWRLTKSLTWATLAATVISPFTEAPGFGWVMVTLGAGLATVTLMGADMTVAPAGGGAVGLRGGGPCAQSGVPPAALQAPPVTGEPRLRPSSWNCTLATSFRCDSAAATRTSPFTVAPALGLEISTAGVGFETTTPMEAEAS